MTAKMDYAAFGKARTSTVVPKSPVTVQIVDVTGANDFVLWDGVRELAAKFIPSDKNHTPILGLKWAVVRVTEQKSFGLKYTVKEFKILESPSYCKSRIILAEPDADSADAGTTSGPLTVEQLTAKTAHDLELVVMSISKISSVNTSEKPGKPGGSKNIVRFMLADETGSVNATAWEANVHKLEGVEPGQLLRITKAFVKQDSPKFQYAATSMYHLTVTDTSEVDIRCFWPPWYKLTTLQDGLATKSAFAGLVMVGDVSSCVYGVKSREVKISDHTVENPLTLQIKGNLAYKIDESLVNKIIVIFNIKADSSGGITASDNQSYFFQVPSECAQAGDVRLWAEENGFIDPTTSSIRDHSDKHQSDSDADSVVVLPRENAKKVKVSAAVSPKRNKKAGTKAGKKLSSAEASNTEDEVSTATENPTVQPKPKSRVKKAGTKNGNNKRVALYSSESDYETLSISNKPAVPRSRRNTKQCS